MTLSDAADAKLNPRGVDRDDPLLGCLVFLTNYYDRPRSADVLVAGLPDSGEGMTAQQFVQSAERVGLNARVVERTAKAIGRLTLPAVLVLRNHQACVLTRLMPGGMAEIALPETGGVRTVKRGQIANAYAGYAILVSPAYRIADEQEGPVVKERGHWFWSTLARSWWIYGQVVLAAFLTNVFALALPIFIMTVYDRVVPNAAMETLTVLTIGVLVTLTFDFLIKTVRSYLIDSAGKRADVIIGRRIFDQVLEIQMAHRPAASGAFANTLQQFETLKDFFASATVATVVDIPFVVIFLLLLYMIGGGPVVGVVFVAVFLLLFLCLFVQVPMRLAVGRGYRDIQNKNALLVEAMSGLETIKAVGAEPKIRHKWESAVVETADSSTRSRFFSSLAVNGAQYIQFCTTIGVIAIGVGRIGEGEMTMGGMIAAMILGTRAMAPLAGIANLLVRLHQAIASLKALNQLMALPSERPAERGFIHRPNMSGAVEFKEVNFTYPRTEVPALSNVGFSVKAGERVGIIGRVGSGKSSIQKLILNLYQPQQGSILIDGIDLRQLDPADLRRHIGYLPQDVILFRGTVRENIAIAAPRADDAAVLRAAELAGVDDFLRRHPQGYDLQVGERGEGLSGGQRQAIGLSRALITDPSLVLLDEPSSSMDTAAEDAFRKRLSGILEGRTLILVTHRNALLPLVDRLIVLDGGRVVADGPRDQIIQALTKGRVTRSPDGEEQPKAAGPPAAGE